ncbi:MAG: histidine phosphatase family protein [Desulfobacteraceae bacterium]|nr:MAG: histidine phosphatase family protein [Desulfobacteraceae bacterium]
MKKNKNKGDTLSIIYLIRHAQASFGQPDYDQLSDIGHLQAAALSDHLEQRGISFNAIYSGTQRRHEQTLAAFRNHESAAGRQCPPVTATGAFNEYDSEAILKTLIPQMIEKNPDFEVEVNGMIRDKRSFQKVYEQVMLKWILSDHSINGLETWRTYRERVISGLQMVMDQQGAGKNVAVFTSGGAISVCVQKALHLSDELALNLTWQIMNASITRLKYSGSRVVLFGFNDAAHLEVKKNNRMITYR